MSLIVPNFETNKLERRFMTKVQNNYENYSNPKNVIEKIRNTQINENVVNTNIIELQNIIGIKSLYSSEQKPKDKKLFLSYNLIFFYEPPNQENSTTEINSKIFFGNSYQSKKIEISMDEGNNITINEDNEKNQIEILFFNPELFEFQIGVELVLVETPLEESEIIENQSVLGWCIINAQNITSNVSTTPIYKGSIRDLNSHNDIHDTSAFELIQGANLYYIFQKNSNLTGLNDIKFLIPPYYFVGNSDGQRDYIPGLLIKHIPNNLNDLNEKVILSNFENIYLKNIHIEFPKLNEVEQHIFEEYKKLKDIPPNGNVDAKINERFCKCFIHNTFKSLLTNNKEPEKIILTKRGDNLINENVIPVENYFVDEKGYCAVVIELFFTLLSNDNKSIEYPIGVCVIIPNRNHLTNNMNIEQESEMLLNDSNLLSDFRELTKIGNNAKAKFNCLLSLSRELTNATVLDKKIEELTNTVQNEKNIIGNKLKGINPNSKIDENQKKQYEEDKKQLEKYNEEYKEIYQREPNISNKENINEQVNPNTNFIIDTQYSNATRGENPSSKIDDPLGQTLENKISGEIRETNYFEEQKKKSLGEQNEYAEYKNLKETQMNESKNNFDSLYNNKLTNTNYPNNEFVNFNNELYNTQGMDQKIISQDKQGNIIYNPDTNKNITAAEISDLINQGILTIPNEDDINKIEIDKSKYIEPSEYDLARANKSLLEYTYNEIIENHSYFGDIFTFQFISFKPLKSLDSYNSVPSSVYFKFSFWNFREFQTENAEISKPIITKNTIPNNIPLFIYKQNAELYENSSDKDMKITISYDPSIDDNIEYRLFVKYLLYKDLFIEIFDNDKQMVFGYVKVPLKKLIRATEKKNLFELIHATVYNNQNFEVKGELEILLKSDETKTSNDYDIYGNLNKFKYFNSIDQYKPNNESNSSIVYYPTSKKYSKKKVVSVGPIPYGKMLKKDKEMVAKTIIENNHGNIDEMLQKKKEMRESRTNAYANFNLKNTFKLDKQTEKKVRVLKYLDEENEETRKNNSSLKQLKSLNNSNNTFIPNEILKANMSKLDKENEFYENLNYANYIKSLNKQKVLEKAINESNKNILSIALIQGEPHYFNYVVTNLTPYNQLYHLVISQTNQKKNINEDEEPIVSIITNPEEYEYITKKYNLKIPNNYSCISEDYQIILKANESIPLVVKLLCFDNITGYDDNIKNKYSIFVQNEKSTPLYYMNINIVNVFPIIDFEFYHNVPQKKLSLIKFINPFKFNNEKTQRLLNYYYFLNINSKPEIKLDSSTNDFYFKYNDLTDNEEDNEDINSNKRLVFFYLDKYRSELFLTFKFNIKSYETIQLSTDIGIRSKNTLNLPQSKISRTVQFFSSDPDCLYFDDKFNEPIILIPNYPYTIEYILYPKQNKNYDILVNCVDIGNGEVIKSYLIKTTPNKPAIYQILKINAQCYTETILKFAFQNPLSTFAVLRFESSNKKILMLDREHISFNGDENQYVNFKILKQSKPGRAEAYIFITDTNELFNQAVALEINYFN